ncbi:hypothetical protein KV112_08135 [Mycolicibacter sp. MYC123]|uniref:ESX-1 secretion-associated protein n=1 Tax=[Mycobacterium] zoologicum TaxID=2872311 RepID=A0ABU5YLV4_9MYCO|nr:MULTISPECIES: hypothetical protein [unclassified Mycolicibacter]MEB3049703.1 hypothetical protein [Mycolicibacter sp. MYC123]MEB3063420.1 hypothetical protein [Mycolicibacter sp. MYC101]
MPSEAPGRRVKVLAAGLRQLSAHCGAVGTELAAEAAAPPMTATTWQTNATAVHAARTAACADLASAANHLNTRAQTYAKAGTDYAIDDQHAAAQFTVLVRR